MATNDETFSDEIRDVMSGRSIGTGYESITIGMDEAREFTDEIMVIVRRRMTEFADAWEAEAAEAASSRGYRGREQSTEDDGRDIGIEIVIDKMRDAITSMT